MKRELADKLLGVVRGGLQRGDLRPAGSQSHQIDDVRPREGTVHQDAHR